MGLGIEILFINDGAMSSWQLFDVVVLSTGSRRKGEMRVRVGLYPPAGVSYKIQIL